MTPIDFVEKLKARRAKAHDLLAEANGFDIRRGMGHSIAGFAEDLFAAYIATNVRRKDLIYFVDKVISYNPAGAEKAKSFKPDLLILNHQNNATHYYDLKTDIGYSRDLRHKLESWNELILQLRGKDAWITVDKKREFEIKFSKEIKYSVVVVIDWNVNKDVLAENIRFANSLKGIEFYVLTNGSNDGDLHVHTNEFQRLMTDCKQHLI